MSIKKQLNSYRGQLNPVQITDGMNVARRNALRLLEDAEILLNSGRYPTALSLAILSIEESGKATILRGLAIAKDNVSLKNSWKEYRTHTAKNAAWISPQLAADGANTLEDLSPIFNRNSPHPYMLDQLKQIGFYTDCLGEAHWSEPSDVIEEDLANLMVSIARIFTVNREVKVKEIELWIKHMSITDNGAYTSQKESLMHWYAEMTELCLIPEGSTFEGFMKFIGVTIDK